MATREIYDIPDLPIYQPLLSVHVADSQMDDDHLNSYSASHDN